MKAVIIDHQAASRQQLLEFCELAESFSDIVAFDSTLKAFNYLQNQHADMLIVEVEMPELSGLDLIQALTEPANVIFTCADPAHAAEAYDIGAIDYLVKPFNYTRFLKAINRSIYWHQLHEKAPVMQEDSPDAIFIKEGTRLVKLHVDNIYYIEAQGDYVSIHTSQKTHLLHTTMKNIEGKLPSSVFFKVHRSYIVNLTHINDIEESIVQIKEFQLPISKAKKDELLVRLRVV